MRCFILLFSLVLLSLVSAQKYRSERDVANQMLKYVKKSQTDEDKDDFSKMVEILSLPKYIYRSSFSSYSKGRQTLTCMTCRSTLDTLIKLYSEGYTEAQIIDVVTDICTLLEIQPRNVCRGIAELNVPIILYIIDNQPKFNSETFCGVVLQSRRKDACPYQDDRFEWTIDLPKKNVAKQLPVAKGSDSFKIVQISDVHYDPAYEANGLAECNEPLCCRKGQTEKASRRWKSLYDDTSAESRVHIEEDGVIYLDIDYAEEVQRLKRNTRALDQANAKNSRNNPKQGKEAGYWGDYRYCDTPWWSFVDGVDQISQTHTDIEYIYYTGDTVDHGVWETTEALISESLNKTLDKFKASFGDTPIFPVIGNHESQPLNQFAPSYIADPKFSTAWLMNLLADKWGVWLPANTKETIKLGGYYTVLLQPGFRVITLNNNLCYVYNWWIHLDPKDPNGQLTWLRDTLLLAENKGEKVHILAHIPAGLTDCFYTYTREYRRIVERFSDTITAEFNGHTHKDEFKIFYEKNNISNPISVAWNGGSLTPFSDVNPNYRVLEVDSQTFDIVDFDMWVYNLTEANLTPNVQPRWYKEYSFKENYGVDSLSPVDVDRLVHRMVRGNKTLLVNDYHNFRGKSSDPFVFGGCDEKCAQNNLCYMTTTEIYDERKCEALWQIYNEV